MLIEGVITAARTATTGPLSGLTLYSWKQQQTALLTGLYEDVLAPLVGTVTSDTVWVAPALEINNATVAVGTNVLLQQRGYVQGVMTYEFAGPDTPAPASNIICWKSPPAQCTTGPLTPLPANVYLNGAAGVGATLTATSFGILPAIDGYTCVNGDTVLVNGESDPTHNGIYVITSIGTLGAFWAMMRRTDSDTSAFLFGATITVNQGSSYANTEWLLTAAEPTLVVGTTALNWVNLAATPVTTGTNSLGTNFSITSNNSMLATGFGLTIPAPGLYLIFGMVNNEAVISVFPTPGSGGNGPVIEFQFDFSGSSITGAFYSGAAPTIVGVGMNAFTSFCFYLLATVSGSVNLSAGRFSTFGTTWTSANVGAGTILNYLKVG